MPPEISIETLRLGRRRRVPLPLPLGQPFSWRNVSYAVEPFHSFGPMMPLLGVEVVVGQNSQ